MGNVTIVCKGPTDIISNGHFTVKVDEMSGKRRCGGQGDLLSGSLATWLSWTRLNDLSFETDSETRFETRWLSACQAACILVRKASFSAYQRHYRGVSAVDILDQISPMFYEWIDSNTFESSRDLSL